MFIEERVALNAKSVGVCDLDKLFRYCYRFVAWDGFDRDTCGDAAKKLNFRGPSTCSGCYEFDGSTFVPDSLDAAFVLKVVEVFVNSGKRRQGESASDFF